MPVELALRLDHEDLKPLNMLKGSVRFAAAKALTKTAKDAQAALKAEAPGVFHLRNNWVVQGIRIDAATPGTLNARVGSIDRYMGRHVSGDPKHPAKTLSIHQHRDDRGRLASGGLLIAPYAGIASAETHRRTRARLNRINGQKRKTFQILSRGGSKVLLVRRTSKKRHPLQVLAILTSDVAEHPIWHMDKTVEGIVEAKFGDHFEAAVSFGKGG